jgi:hypothetical protein
MRPVIVAFSVLFLVVIVTMTASVALAADVPTAPQCVPYGYWYQGGYYYGYYPYRSYDYGYSPNGYYSSYPGSSSYYGPGHFATRPGFSFGVWR